MSSGTIQDGHALQNDRDNYRSAFRHFAEAVEGRISLERGSQIDFLKINAARTQLEDAQRACREARNRYACGLLEARRQKLMKSWTPAPARLELIAFVSRAASLFANDKDLSMPIQQQNRGDDGLARLSRSTGF